jgi:hypothetical protein
MAITPAGYLSQEKLEAEIERVKQLLGPEVVRVRYSVGRDWSDESSLRFRIVLTDPASRPEVLRDVAERIDDILFNEQRPYELGMRMYTNFRSQSEQIQRDGIDRDWT